MARLPGRATEAGSGWRQREAAIVIFAGTIGKLTGIGRAVPAHPLCLGRCLYKLWMDRGYFNPVVDPSKRPLVVIMPPPNVTGEIHIGHALTATIEEDDRMEA